MPTREYKGSGERIKKLWCHVIVAAGGPGYWLAPWTMHDREISNSVSYSAIREFHHNTNFSMTPKTDYPGTGT